MTTRRPPAAVLHSIVPLPLLLFGPDPIPGGGACPDCVTDVAVDSQSEPSELSMCVRKESMYLGTRPGPEDDLPLVQLLTSPAAAKWKAQLKVESGGRVEWKDLCAAGSCKAAMPPEALNVNKETSNGQKLVMAVPPGFPRPSGMRIVFTQVRDKAFPPREEMLPTITVPEGTFGTQLECSLAPAAAPAWNPKNMARSPSDEPLGQLALITYGSRYGGLRSCSGVRIADDAILTAAHCFDEFPAMKQITVVVGAERPYQELDKALPVKYMVRHPKYDALTLAYDLAIVRLKQPRPYTRTFMVEAPPEAKNCMTHVLGYGVRPDPTQWYSKPYYDSGVRHGETLNDLSSVACATDSVACVKKSLFIPLKAKEALLCHGDSGGAVFKYCQSGNYLVAVATARLGKYRHFKDIVSPMSGDGFKDPPLTRHVPAEGGGFEAVPLGAPLAFSQGNACGAVAEAPGFIAAHIDYEWVKCVLDGEASCLPPSEKIKN